jgi:two-component system response regulator RegA
MAESVLIIDDDEVLRYAMNRALSRLGCQVSEAANLSETRQVLCSQQIDWVVLDLRLDHESGLAVAQEILQHDARITIVIITGYASVSTAVEAIKLGVRDYLIKPVSAEEIIQALRSGGDKQDVVINQTPMSPKRLEWEHIQKVLLAHGGNITQAAKALKMHRRTLQRKLQKKPVKE